MGYFAQTARRYHVPLALLLAIASRESRMGLALSADGTGDRGNGIGIMQIDRRYHPDFTSRHNPFDHGANIDYGGQYLGSLLQQFGGNTTRAAAAYNAGPESVKMALGTGLPADSVTTGGNYAADVRLRTNLIEDLMGLSKAASAAVYIIPAGFILLTTYNFATISSP